MVLKLSIYVFAMIFVAFSGEFLTAKRRRVAYTVLTGVFIGDFFSQLFLVQMFMFLLRVFGGENFAIIDKLLWIYILICCGLFAFLGYKFATLFQNFKFWRIHGKGVSFRSFMGGKNYFKVIFDDLDMRAK